jgi:hypothetical protein
MCEWIYGNKMHVKVGQTHCNDCRGQNTVSNIYVLTVACTFVGHLNTAPSQAGLLFQLAQILVGDAVHSADEFRCSFRTGGTKFQTFDAVGRRVLIFDALFAQCALYESAGCWIN